MGLAIGCYALWGLTPIYWKAVGEVPAEQALIPRVLWTLALLLVASLVTRQLAEAWRASLRAWLSTLAAAFLLAANWTLFIHAVQSDQVLATSLGYYINPLMSILLGLVVLGERLNRAQTLAVAVAALGVATLTFREGALPWISLLLAASFALYGLIHKLSPQPPLGGLTREMLVLSPFTLGGLAWLATQEQAALIEAPFDEQALLSLSGLVTAAPLLLFHAATRRLPLVAVGMFQYIAPTLTLALATLHYGEPFTPSHAGAFGMVWVGLALFTFDSIRRAAVAARVVQRPSRNAGA
jgi:chloramphenicol-sensitive protein RarD